MVGAEPAVPARNDRVVVLHSPRGGLDNHARLGSGMGKGECPKGGRTMANRMSRGLAAVMAVGLVTALAACGTSAQASSPAVATVGHDTITKQDWLSTIKSLGMLNGSPLSTNKAAEYSQVKQLMVWSAVEQYVLAHHWSTTAQANKQASTALGQIEKQAGSKAALVKRLKSQGLTMANFSSFLTSQEILQAAYGRVTKNVPKPTAAAVQKYYSQNKSSFVQPATDTVQAILVKTKAQATSLETELKAGKAKFAALAKADSLDKASAANGGQMGPIPKSVTTAAASGIPSAFVTVMDTLKVGQYGIASTPSGYYLMQVTAVTPASTQSFSTVKSQIASQLLSTSQSNAFQSFGMQQLKKMPHAIKVKS